MSLSPNPFRDLDRAKTKRAELAFKAAARREAEAAKEAEERRRIEEAEATERAEREAAEALSRELAEQDAEIDAIERQIEANRLAKLKADASTPEIVAAFWAQAQSDYETLRAVNGGTIYQQMPQYATIALRTATGFDVDPDLWHVETGGNIAFLRDFAGMNWRCLRVANTMREALNVRDVFVVQVETPFNSWASVICPGSVAQLLPQYPSMRPGAGQAEEGSA